MTRDVGAPALARRLRVPVARRGRGRPRRSAGAPATALPRGALRAARRRARAELRRICEFAGLPFDPGMLDYARPGRRLAEAAPAEPRAGPRRPGLRDWRTELRPEDVVRLRGGSPATCWPSSATSSRRASRRRPIAGPAPASSPTACAPPRGGAPAHVARRLPLWRRRHPYLE